MKKITLTFLLIITAFFAQAQTVFINELHYDNTGADVGEFVEIAGPAGTDLTGWTVEFYNGANGSLYSTLNLSGTIDDEGSGYGALSFLEAGIQNGAPDGLALIDNTNTVIQFLSYEGAFTATAGTANGQASTDIGVSEQPAPAVGQSLQLIGSGNLYSDFSWTGPVAESPGTINVNQTFSGGAGNPPVISCPSTIMINNTAGECSAVANYAGTAIDTEDGDISGDIVYSPPSGSTFPVGTTTVTASVTDSDGNTSTCTFDVTVNDVEDPVVVCTDFTAQLDATGNVTVFPGDVATATDNCPTVTLEFGAPAINGSLTTTFASNNGQSGNMFDIVALNDITIESFDINMDSGVTDDVEVYFKTGPYLPSVNTPGDWTLVATTNVTSVGTDVPTPLNLNLGINVTAGQTVAFYVTLTSTTAINYTNGSTTGSLFASDANLEFYEGAGLAYPFASNFNPRVFNGNIIYNAGGSLSSSLDFTCMDIGPNNVQVTATDASGNTSTCSAVITIEDNIAPVIACAGEVSGAPVFINEIHYDNTGADQDEAIEIAGPAGTDLSSYSIVLYNGNGGTEYNTVALSGTIDDEGDGFGAINFPITGIQNGSPDGIVLANNGNVIQFLSYEGSFTAVDGIASGLTSTDIGVSEPSSTPIGESLQLTGTGTYYPDFTWNAPSASSPGDINIGQTFLAPTSTVYDATLDGTTGTVTVNVADLLLSVDEACGYTVTSGGGAPIPGSITTLFATNNNGSQGG
ncbi:HYR domain-containing protein, partial [Aureisphaera sp. CAU 1614]